MRTIINYLRFLAVPFFVALLLAFEAITEPADSVAYTQKLGAALAMYGLGSLIPYLLSDEILHHRFGEVSTEGGYHIKFHPGAKETLDFVKSFVWSLIVVGIALWVLNIMLPVRLSTSQPTLANWFWMTGVIFCMLTGVLFVIINSPPSSEQATPTGTRPTAPNETSPKGVG